METAMKVVAKQVGQQGGRGGTKLRQGVCIEVQNLLSGMCTISATVDGATLTGVACVSGIYPQDGQGVWLLSTKGGKWLCIGGVGSDTLPTICGSYAIFTSSRTEKIRLIGGTADNNYISFWDTTGTVRKGYLQSDAAQTRLVSEGTDARIHSDGGDVHLSVAGNNNAVVVSSEGRYVFFGKTLPNNRSTGVEVDESIGRMWITHNHNSNSSNLLLNRENPDSIGSGYMFVQFQRANANIGSITIASSTSVAYNTSSDERLKTRLGPIIGAWERVKAIEVGKFRWTEGGEEDEGFYAQSLINQIPGAVTPGEEDPHQKPWMVDYSKSVPVLTATLQEAQDRIEALEAARAADQVRMDALEARLAALESHN